MQSVQISEAQSHLSELVDSLADGEEVLITRNNLPVAKLIASKTDTARRPSIRNIQPVSVGAILRPLSSDDDLLGEMSEA